MKLSDFENLSLDRAQTVKRYVASIRPVLQDLSEQYNGIISSGYLSQMISSNKEDYWFEEPPNIRDSNTALGYLAYNDVISIEDDEWKLSVVHHNNIDIDSYDDEKCKRAITYLDWQSWQHMKNSQTFKELGNNKQLEFNNFQEYYENII